jgi:CRP-like cAMP-binding protein
LSLFVGQKGDYFYVIESGKFSIVVDGKVVGNLSKGQSFGELALLYNSPRQATVKSDTNGFLFSLDRETYKLIVAQSSSERSLEIKKALVRVPLLQDLTEDQLEKLTDTVEIFAYNPGRTPLSLRIVSHVYPSVF